MIRFKEYLNEGWGTVIKNGVRILKGNRSIDKAKSTVNKVITQPSIAKEIAKRLPPDAIMNITDPLVATTGAAAVGATRMISKIRKRNNE
jgi:hypothetical protein